MSQRGVDATSPRMCKCFWKAWWRSWLPSPNVGLSSARCLPSDRRPVTLCAGVAVWQSGTSLMAWGWLTTLLWRLEFRVHKAWQRWVSAESNIVHVTTKPPRPPSLYFTTRLGNLWNNEGPFPTHLLKPKTGGNDTKTLMLSPEKPLWWDLRESMTKRLTYVLKSIQKSFFPFQCSASW